MQRETILVPLDGSALAETALPTAVALAETIAGQSRPVTTGRASGWMSAGRIER